MKAFRCGTLVDVLNESTRNDVVVLVEDGLIKQVDDEESISVPSSAEVIDLSDKVTIPGLIDAHVHLDGRRSVEPFEWLQTDISLAASRAIEDLNKALSVGLTTVRDVGSRTGIGLRKAVEEGTVTGPRIHTSERVISQTAGHGDAHMLPHDWVMNEKASIMSSVLADGPAECRKVTRKQLRKGVDVVKIMTSGGIISEKDDPRDRHMTDAEIEAVTEEAHRVGKPVASHATSPSGIKGAVRNGVDTIEHGCILDEEAIDLMKETGAIFVPTLAINHQTVKEGEAIGLAEYSINKAKAVWEQHKESVKRAYQEGVPIALGSDFWGADHASFGENLLEAELLVNIAGMSEIDVIKAGTYYSAQTVADNRVGSIAEGKYGDLVALNDDPLKDISNIESVDSVYKEGEKVVDSNATEP